MRHSLSTALPRIFSFACLSSFGKKFENEKKVLFCNTLSKTTPRKSKQVAQRKISLRSSWLPLYRPCSFASQPFDCFAENIQFTLRSRFHFLDAILPHRTEPVNCFGAAFSKNLLFLKRSSVMPAPLPPFCAAGRGLRHPGEPAPCQNSRSASRGWVHGWAAAASFRTAGAQSWASCPGTYRFQ